MGRIKSESIGPGHCGLSIAVEDRPDDYVQLNSNGKDTGSAGWSWYCENFLGGPQWLPLGDHNA